MFFFGFHKVDQPGGKADYRFLTRTYLPHGSKSDRYSLGENSSKLPATQGIADYFPEIQPTGLGAKIVLFKLDGVWVDGNRCEELG